MIRRIMLLMLIFSISQWSWATMAELSMDQSMEQTHENLPDHPEPSEDCDDCEKEKEMEDDFAAFHFLMSYSHLTYKTFKTHLKIYKAPFLEIDQRPPRA